jgi:hypothetical protein
LQDQLSTSSFTGVLKGIITGVSTDATNGNSSIDVKILSRVSTAGTTSGTETKIRICRRDLLQASYLTTSTIRFVNNSGITTGSSVGLAGVTPVSVTDWYEKSNSWFD